MSDTWEHLDIRAPVPSGVPLVLLLRHAERPALSPHEPGNEVSLTAAGREAASRLGAHLGSRMLGLHTSPVRRCLETAEALREGAGTRCTVVHDRMLGDPGVLVSDPEQAWATWLARGPDAIYRSLMVDEAALPGFAEPREATQRLAAHLLTHLPQTPGVHVFVSHDILLGTFIARALGRALEGESWPGFLHGALLWREERRLRFAYQQWTGTWALGF